MESQKILNLLNEASDSSFDKWDIDNDQSNANYDVENKVTQNIEVLKSNLCDYHDAYILLWCRITQLALKICAPFIKWITKVDGTGIDAEELVMFMSKYSLLERSWNYSDTIGSLWFYSKEESTNVNNDIEGKKFVGKIKNLHSNGNVADAGSNQSMSVSTILKNIKEAWLKLFQEGLAVL